MSELTEKEIMDLTMLSDRIVNIINYVKIDATSYMASKIYSILASAHDDASFLLTIGDDRDN
jgi:hypothetical protein